jgi:hypothetical protein
MLIENSRFHQGEIINIKLISGDEIVGELVGQDTSSYELRKPCVVVTSPEGIGLIQAMFGLDPDRENLRFRNDHVITTCHTHDKMRDHYITVTTSEG